jgi:hypothetical protein
MVGLTTKQREELNNAIYEYLVKSKYANSAQAFAEECQIKIDSIQSSVLNGSHHAGSSMKDILERKWTSIAKLKKEVDELSKQNKLLKE